MSGLIRRMRARHSGGLTSAEAMRREEIAIAAARGQVEVVRELPRSVLADRISTRAISVDEAIDEIAARNGAADPSAILDQSDPALDEPEIAVPDARIGPGEEDIASERPHYVISISGPEPGLSVLCHVIRERLAYEGLIFEGPAGLKSMAWRRGARELIDHDPEILLVATVGAEL